MRVLIDESLPRQLARELSGCEGRTVQQQGWSSLENGELLRRAAEHGFLVFLTADQGIEYQQNLAGLAVGVVIIRAVSNRMEHLRPLVGAMIEAIAAVRKGEVVRVPSDLSRRPPD